MLDKSPEERVELSFQMLRRSIPPCIAPYALSAIFAAPRALLAADFALDLATFKPSLYTAFLASSPTCYAASFPYFAPISRIVLLYVLI
jgi:hypothetical protein